MSKSSFFGLVWSCLMVTVSLRLASLLVGKVEIVGIR